MFVFIGVSKTVRAVFRSVALHNWTSTAVRSTRYLLEIIEKYLSLLNSKFEVMDKLLLPVKQSKKVI